MLVDEISLETILKDTIPEQKQFLHRPTKHFKSRSEITELECAAMAHSALWVGDEKNNALGLAAPQIGSDKSWFVIKWSDGRVEIIVNPSIIGKLGTKRHIEGCFSCKYN